jgi:hypothetical protein
VFAHTRLLKEPGIFVEFGARDGPYRRRGVGDGRELRPFAGIYESNTWLLETALGWSGLLIEAGRDYIAGLRKQRKCRVSGRPGACCWMALDAEANRTRFWSTTDRTMPSMTEAQVDHWELRPGQGPERDRATVADRAVRTERLSTVLHHFGVTHVDYLSADCEGCEEGALASLDFVHPTVDVLTVEGPGCELLKKFAAAGYVVLPINFSQDVVFVHARVAAAMPRPDLNPPTQGSAIGRQRLRKRLEQCPEVEEGVFWGEDDVAVWPPPAPMRIAAGASSPSAASSRDGERLNQLERKAETLDGKLDKILAALGKAETLDWKLDKILAALDPSAGAA